MFASAALLFGRVPLMTWALLAVLAWGGYQRYQAISATDKLTHAIQQAKLDVAAAKIAADAETAAIKSRQQEALNDQSKKLAAARADADAATAGNKRLLQRLAAYRDQRAGDTPAASGSASATGSASVLADVFGKCVERREELARYADAARTAGTACERSYDALKVRTQ